MSSFPNRSHVQAQGDSHNSVYSLLCAPMAGMWSHLHTDRGGGRAAPKHNQNRGGGSAASSSGHRWVEAKSAPKSLPLQTLQRDIRYDDDDDELPDMDAQSSHVGCDQMSTLIICFS